MHGRRNPEPGSLTYLDLWSRRNGSPDELPYPPAVLRRYEGAIELHEGVVALHDGVVLPESLKWHLTPKLSNTGLVDIDARWARLRDREVEIQQVAGSHDFFDYKNSGHHGHLLTEAVSKLWGWQVAKDLDPELRLLGGPRSVRSARTTQARSSVCGIDDDDVCTLAGPVRVSSLVGATPLLHAKEPYHVLPLIAEVWARLRAGLALPGGRRRPQAHLRDPARGKPSVPQRCRAGRALHAGRLRHRPSW